LTARAIENEMTDIADTSARFARFVAETGFDHVPPAVIHEAKRSLINFFATAISGCRDRPFEIALRSLLKFSGGQQATLIGRTERIDTLSAAFLNAVSTNISDFDDTHLPTVIHPTAPVAPALLALSETKPISGADLLLAFVLGVEIECRIGNAISPAHYRRGWHITATCGVFGSAMAAGKLLGLDDIGLVWALANAATQSSGLVESLGHDAKSISIGNSARNGLWAALLAADGFAGPAHPIEGRFGFFNALGETPDRAALLDGFGESWELSKNSYKPYPGGIVIHPVIDCVLDLRRAHPIAPTDIERIVVSGNPLLSDRANRPNVTSGRESQVSVQHSVAAAMLFGKAGLDEYTDACVLNPAVLDLRRKVELKQDSAIPVQAAVVEVFAKNGDTHQASVNAARGSAQRPLSDAELEDKLFTLAAALGPKDALRRLADAVWTLDRMQDVSAVLSLARPARL
jgi:2-methylcitrate dehydratase PrpD